MKPPNIVSISVCLQHFKFLCVYHQLASYLLNQSHVGSNPHFPEPCSSPIHLLLPLISPTTALSLQVLHLFLEHRLQWKCHWQGRPHHRCLLRYRRGKHINGVLDLLSVHCWCLFFGVYSTWLMSMQREGHDWPLLGGEKTPYGKSLIKQLSVVLPMLFWFVQMFQRQRTARDLLIKLSTTSERVSIYAVNNISIFLFPLS